MRSTISRGLPAISCCGSRPKPSSAPGRKFSTSTSACSASARTIATSSASLRSSATERLLRDCTCHHTEVPSLSNRHWRSGSPPLPGSPGGSTLITSAPKSASVLAANGPAMSWPSSSTRSPASGPLVSSEVGVGFIVVPRIKGGTSSARAAVAPQGRGGGAGAASGSRRPSSTAQAARLQAADSHSACRPQCSSARPNSQGEKPCSARPGREIQPWRAP